MALLRAAKVREAAAVSLALELTAAAFPDLSGARDDRELVSLWLEGLSANTRSTYTRELAWWARAMGNRPLREIRLRDLQKGLELAEGAPASIVLRIRVIRSLLTFAHETGYVPFNIGRAIRIRRVPSKLAERILDPEQVHALLAATKAGDETDGRRRTSRDHAIVRLLYSSGARVSELAGLRWHEVHGGDPPSVTLHGKGGKTRTVPISKPTFRELEASRPTDAAEGPVFLSRYGEPLAARDIRRLVARAALAAGLRELVSPHWLRHSHATHAMKRGCPPHVVRTNLGHSSMETTSQYLHARPGEGSALYLDV